MKKKSYKEWIRAIINDGIKLNTINHWYGNFLLSILETSFIGWTVVFFTLCYVASKLIINRFHSIKVSCQVRTISSVIKDEIIGHENNNETEIALVKIDYGSSDRIISILRSLSPTDFGRIKHFVIQFPNVNNDLEQVSSILKSYDYHVSVDSYGNNDNDNNNKSQWGIYELMNVVTVYARKKKQRRT